LVNLLKDSPSEFMVLDDNMEGIEQEIVEVLIKRTGQGKQLLNVEKFQRLVESKFKNQ
jgi:hypothetical protein